MKSIKRPLSLLLCAALVLGLLVGCSKKVETAPSSAQTEGPTTQATAEPTTEPVETLRTEHREQLDPDGFLLRTTDSVYDSQDRLVEETVQCYQFRNESRPEFPDYSWGDYERRLFWTKHSVYSDQGALQEESFSVYDTNFGFGDEHIVFDVVCSQHRTFDAAGNVTNETLSSSSNETTLKSCNLAEIEAYLQSIPCGETILADLLSGTQEISQIYLVAYFLPAYDDSSSEGYFVTIYAYDLKHNLTYHYYWLTPDKHGEYTIYVDLICTHNSEGQCTRELIDQHGDRYHYDSTHFYNSNGQLDRTLHLVTSSDDPEYFERYLRLYSYDEQNRLVGEVLTYEYDDNDYYTYAGSYSYNDKGWLVKEKYYEYHFPSELSFDELISTLQFSDVYDPLSNLSDSTYTFTEGDWWSTYTYTYDEKGVLTTETLEQPYEAPIVSDCTQDPYGPLQSGTTGRAALDWTIPIEKHSERHSQ